MEFCWGEMNFEELMSFSSPQLSEYLVRLSRALAWSECTAPPAPGADTTMLAETLLERSERLVAQHDHHHTLPLDHKHWDSFHTLHPHAHSHQHQHPHPHPHHFKSLKLRRERSCHDLPAVKESTAMYNLQRRVHALKDQIQRKDLQMELLKRKLTLMEEGVRGKCIIQVVKSSQTFNFLYFEYLYCQFGKNEKNENLNSPKIIDQIIERT